MPIAIIPARSGSKGVPYKNFTPIDGSSPLQRAVTCCLAAGVTPWVSSDLSPLEGWPYWLKTQPPLHSDTCLMHEVVLDALGRIPGDAQDIVLLVQPTQPLRHPGHLRAALEMMEDGAHNVCSVAQAEPPEKLYHIRNGFVLPALLRGNVERRQDAEAAYRCDGTVYAFRRGAFLECPLFRTPKTRALIIPPDETAALDTPADWALAELRLKARR